MPNEQYLQFFEDLRRIHVAGNRPRAEALCDEREGGEPQRPYLSADEAVSIFDEYFRSLREETERVSNDL